MSQSSNSSANVSPDRPAAWPGHRWATLLGILVIFIAVAIIYSPAWHGGFVWDDQAHVTAPELRSLSGLARIWFELNATQQYYPLLHSAFWVEHSLWGDNTLGYHLVNVILHSTAACLAWAVLARLKIPGAWLAAVIFAVHPVNVESVAWITEQKNTLSTVFYLVAMWLYLRFDEDRRSRWYWSASLVFLLGLFAKTVIATLPAALLVIFWWRRGQISWRRDVRPLIPWFVAGAALGVLTAWVERRYIGAIGDEYTMSFINRCLLAGRVVWFYLYKLLWPVELIFSYPRWEIDFHDWWHWLYPIALVALIVGLWSIRSRSRAPLAVALFFIGTLFPVLGFLNVYPFRYTYVADHFQYLACLGVIALVVGAFTLAIARLRLVPRIALQVGCLAVVGLLGWLSFCQAKLYADAYTLDYATLEANPRSWLMHGQLAFEYNSTQQIDNAIEHYEAAIRLNPRYTEAHNNLACILRDTGHPDEARRHFETALAIRPDSSMYHLAFGLLLRGTGHVDEAIGQFREAIAVSPEFAEGHAKLGDALASQNKFKEAAQEYEEAIHIAPDQPAYLNNLAGILSKLGQYYAARVHLERALTFATDYAKAHYNLGLTQIGSGKFRDARTHLERALELDPQRTDVGPELAKVHLELGREDFTANRIDEALAHFQRASELSPGFAAAHANLGVALRRAGRFDGAISQLEEAVRLDPTQYEFHHNLGNALKSAGRFDDAREHFTESVRLNPQFALGWLALATLEEAAGRREEVFAAAEKALELARAQNNEALVKQIEGQLQAYRAGATQTPEGKAAAPNNPDAEPSAKP